MYRIGRTTLETYRIVPEKKLGVGVEKQVGKPTTWAWENKSKQESPPRKLIDMLRSGNWACK